MLNKEKYAKEILDNVCEGGGFSKVRGVIKTCTNTSCLTCDFYNPKTKNCKQNLKAWAYSEYIEPDWTKVPVDTPIIVRISGSDRCERRYFAGFRDGEVYAWNNGMTSWTAFGKDTAWDYAELAESEDQNDKQN